jgi:class 3 adenylate cyclase
MTDQTPYGRIDRALHRLAFTNLNAQKMLADIESRLYRDRLSGVASKRPVFVTSLPRAGTTLLLDVLHSMPEFASATYRHMPFALCPLLWRSVAERFRRQATLTERAHGDGMQVGFDSPEAFEEIVWKAFWQRHYGTDRIEPWKADNRDGEFDTFFDRYMRTVIAAAGPPAARYLSKNNANISRLELLSDLFPDCKIVIPIRNPWAQAASLERQHKRFCRIHAEAPFALQYVTWLGHFEFGAALKPIDFDGWVGSTNATTDTQIFWLNYWAAAYAAILSAKSNRLVLIDYDALCQQPAPFLTALGYALAIDDPRALAAQALRFRKPDQVAIPDVDPALIERVKAVYSAARLRGLKPVRHQAANSLKRRDERNFASRVRR